MTATPPAPWTWQRARPFSVGEDATEPEPSGPIVGALVAGDGTRLLWSVGVGHLGVHAEVRDLLPLLAPDVADLSGSVVEAEVAVGLLAEVRRLIAERDLARGLAWSYEHRQFDYAALGVDLDEQGEPVEPSWLTSPAAPYETVLRADLARFAGGTYGTAYGQQVAGLAVGDYTWVTDKGEESDDVDTVYAQVREVGGGWVRVQVLTTPTDVRQAPAALPADGSS